jgi:hypothetical protein
VVAPDRRAARGQYGVLVWVASLDGARLQEHQTGGLAVAVARLWLLSVGGEAEATIPANTVPDVTAWVPEQPRTRRATRLRLVSVLRRGWILILVALLEQAPLPRGRFIPEPWPAVTAREEPAPVLPDPEMPLAA